VDGEGDARKHQGIRGAPAWLPRVRAARDEAHAARAFSVSQGAGCGGVEPLRGLREQRHWTENAGSGARRHGWLGLLWSWAFTLLLGGRSSPSCRRRAQQRLKPPSPPLRLSSVPKILLPFPKPGPLPEVPLSPGQDASASRKWSPNLLPCPGRPSTGCSLCCRGWMEAISRKQWGQLAHKAVLGQRQLRQRAAQATAACPTSSFTASLATICLPCPVPQSQRDCGTPRYHAPAPAPAQPYLGTTRALGKTELKVPSFLQPPSLYLSALSPCSVVPGNSFSEFPGGSSSLLLCTCPQYALRPVRGELPGCTKRWVINKIALNTTERGAAHRLAARGSVSLWTTLSSAGSTRPARKDASPQGDTESGAARFWSCQQGEVSQSS